MAYGKKMKMKGKVTGGKKGHYAPRARGKQRRIGNVGKSTRRI
jgi:hypothetical protein